MKPEQKRENHKLAGQLLSEQDFRKAFFAGLLVMIAITTVWVAMAASAGTLMGYMAMALGAGVGYTIRFVGKGIQARYTVLAMALALAGCVAGNIMAPILIESIDHQLAAREVLGVISARVIVDFVFAGLGLIDLIFWIIAVSAAGYLARRRLTRQEQLAMFTWAHSPGSGAGTD